MTSSFAHSTFVMEEGETIRQLSANAQFTDIIVNIVIIILLNFPIFSYPYQIGKEQHIYPNTFTPLPP